MPEKIFDNSVANIAQPVVLETLRKVIRALEIVEGEESRVEAKNGILKAKNTVLLFANIWGAEFTQDSQVTPVREKRPRGAAGVPRIQTLLLALEEFGTGAFTSFDAAAASGCPPDYVQTTFFKLKQLGRIRKIGERQSPRGGQHMNVYVLGEDRNAVR